VWTDEASASKLIWRWITAALPLMRPSSGFAAEATPEVDSGALRCAEPAVYGGMLNAICMLASFGTTADIRGMYFYTISLDFDDESKIAFNKLWWFWCEENDVNQL